MLPNRYHWRKCIVKVSSTTRLLCSLTELSKGREKTCRHNTLELELELDLDLDLVLDLDIDLAHDFLDGESRQQLLNVDMLQGGRQTDKQTIGRPSSTNRHATIPLESKHLQNNARRVCHQKASKLHVSLENAGRK